MAGTLFVVATPIGNLEDITLRALRVLREVSLIAAEDTRRTAHLLARHAISTPTTSLHEHNEQKKTASLIARLHAGEDIAVVSDAGTPTISDPGGHLIRAAIDAKIRVVPIPGPSAVIAALSASGMPTETFTFLGFPPIRAKDRNSWFARLKATTGTAVFFEAPHRIEQTLADLTAAVGERPVTVARELTKSHEELVTSPTTRALSSLGSLKGEFTVVVYLGESQNLAHAAAPGRDELARQFGELTEKSDLTRRQAVAELARRHRMRPNDVYSAIESAKHSGE
jgi:16S rRNA (cytidine1402-2'-O)-methyltransferase